jgi:hypothetical protein
MDTAPDSEDGYALSIANGSYEWYRQAAIRSRRALKPTATDHA